MAPASDGDGTQDKDAKEVLDEFGQKVYEEKVKSDAKIYKDDLKGLLSLATASEETAGSNDPCEFKYDELLGGKSNRYPCANRSPVRFSDESRSQCTYNRIKDSDSSNGKDCGACAPFRRLSVCDRNLELMNRKKNKARHKLLLDVCLAAKFEAESLIPDHAHYVAKYGDSGSTICTVLARSFADIGDIVRGKDLYLGYDDKEKKQRQQLEDKLKDIFTQIHNGLPEGKKSRYENDTKNYYKLREDWWTANRATVWKAITCSKKLSNSKYFRLTCDTGKGPSVANHYCRCDGDKPGEDKPNIDPPTYFDYVPQYLRWFEEWAEDFCRKRKHKLENAKKQCRGEDDNKYCSRNGFDCKETIRGINKLVKSEDCTKCSVLCTPFVKWIDNKKLEFEKQKNKYEKEIEKYKNGTSNGTTIKIGNATINNWYVKEFYEKLQDKYGDVKNFLGLLNKETTCKDHPKVEGKSHIDFTEGKTEKTFSHTEYCETCPWCATKEKQNGKWENKDHESDCPYEGITPLDDSKSTEIELLVKDKTGKTMVQKLGSLCNGSKLKYHKWKCYYDQSSEENSGGGDKNYCVLQDGNKDNPQNRTIKSYYTLFLNWIDEMLKDSIDWSKELNSCINNNSGKCIKSCKKHCECFKKWVGKKREEWEQLENRYEKENFSEGIDIPWTPYGILEMYLKNIYLEMIQKDYRKEESVQKMEEIIEKNQEIIVSVKKDNNSITKFLEYEEQEAGQCVSNNPEKNCKPKERKAPSQRPQPTGDRGARILRGRTNSQDDEDDEEEEEEENTSDVEDEGAGEGGQDDVVDTGSSTEDTDESVPKEAVPEVKKDDVKVCKIVDKALDDMGSLTQVCQQKYVIVTIVVRLYSGGESGSSDSNQGSICVPPRRRRLYVGKLQEWAKSDKTEAKSSQGGESSQGTEASASSSSSDSNSVQTTLSSSPSHPRDVDGLRDAFIESAAIETFFLWDRYKKLNTPQSGSSLGGAAGELAAGLGLMPPEVPEGAANDEKNPEEQLKEGKIPKEFKRQMFYTLGDYRDILFGINIGSFKNMEEIQNKIKNVFPDSEKINGKKFEEQRKDFWENYGSHIWYGMLCALSYDANGEKIEMDNDVRDNLIGDTKKKNNKYDYDKVTINSVGPNGDSTSLLNFAKRPPFFRWLQEWGEEFCRKRTDKLKKAKDMCQGYNAGGNKIYCSGDGHDCIEKNLKHNDMFADLVCRDCHKQCRKYKNWIEKKVEEFYKQKNKYEEEFKTLKDNSSGDKNCCKDIEKHKSAADFLKALRHCKDGQTGGEKGNEEYDKNKIDFSNPLKTFGPLEYCKTCPLNGVTCNGSGRGKSGNDQCTAVNGNGETWQSVFNANGENSTANITVEMIDRRGPFIDKNSEKLQKSNDSFKTSPLFKGLRVQNWECKFENENKDVCKLNKFDANIDLNEYTTFKVLIVYWLEDFIEGYYILKKRKVFEQCKENGGNTCDDESKNDCACAKVWIDKKKNEWGDIKNLLNEQYKGDNAKMDPSVRSSLVDLINGFAPKIDKGRHKGSVSLVKLFECFCNNISENSGGNDPVKCLLKKLEDKIGECEKKHPKNRCDTQAKCEEYTPPDDEEPLEETEENQVEAPKICENVLPEPEPEPVVEGDCEAAETPIVPENGEPKEDEQQKEDKDGGPAGPAPAPAPESPAPAAPPSTPRPQPLPSDNTSDILKTTIPFGIALALTSIALLFLKKKPKSPVDLIRVLDIHKGDYGTPTPKSKNRYIPYRSGTYKGKTYIYMEGDSSGDEKYAFMSDTTDVTSSESEYEEMDINDIYVPGSPKYKTLIEVVLEPSGKLSGNTIPTSGKNTPSDTQNDIQNDDIPSSKITDNEWNTLKHDFISNMLQNTQNTEPNILHDNLDNNTNPTPSHNELDQKPFITSIHDRNLLSAEEYSYDMTTNSANNDLYSGQNNLYSDVDSTSGNRGSYSEKNDSLSDNHHPYSGIDLINDSLNSGNQPIDIYDELLKRKENELFGTNHVKQTSIHSVAKPARDDPIHNQLELFHK
ncbi:hypothetical protein PFAG_06065, partial [Plasmodium falciparum Santa Lucia]